MTASGGAGAVRVKICGINSPAAFDAAVGAGADWIGFIFYPASPRAVTPSAAARLSARLPGGPKRVGLFVDPSDALLAEATDALRLDALQLYAPPARIASIRAVHGIPVWRSVSVRSMADLPEDGGVAAALVIEPGRQAPGQMPGGNGQALDWGLLRGWRPAAQWLLAGGLTPDNVGLAIQRSGATAVDVSSGVERAPGVKDPALIRRFVDAARRQDGAAPPQAVEAGVTLAETGPGHMSGQRVQE